MIAKESTVIRELRQRLKHNEAYLAQSVQTHALALDLSAVGVSPADLKCWLEGEEFAIRAENEWIERLLRDYVSSKTQK